MNFTPLQQKIEKQKELVQIRKQTATQFIDKFEAFLVKELDNYEVFIQSHEGVKSSYLDLLYKYVIVLTPYGFRRIKVDPFLGKLTTKFAKQSDYEEARKSMQKKSSKEIE